MELIDVANEFYEIIQKFLKQGYKIDPDDSYITMIDKLVLKNGDIASETNWFTINKKQESIDKAITSLTNSVLENWDIIDKERNGLDENKRVILIFELNLLIYPDNNQQNVKKELHVLSCIFSNKNELKMSYNDLVEYTR